MHVEDTASRQAHHARTQPESVEQTGHVHQERGRRRLRAAVAINAAAAAAASRHCRR